MDQAESALRPTRRHLLAGMGLGVIGAMAAGATAQTSRAAPAPSRLVNLERADSSTWSRYVGQDFTISDLTGVTLRLIAVQSWPSSAPRPAGVRAGQFFALFESVGRAVPAGDSTYTMGSRAIAPMPMYLSRRAVVSGRHRFVASFG